MNKIDKFLYGRFAVVALASITTMLVSVFSPPKQPAEETAETPTTPQIEQASPEPSVAVEPTQTAIEYGVRYYDDNGNEIVPTQKILDAFKALDEERKRKEEEAAKAEKEWGKAGKIGRNDSRLREPCIQRLPSIPPFTPPIPKEEPEIENAAAYNKMGRIGRLLMVS